MSTEPDEIPIRISTILSHRTQEGRVCIQWKGLDEQLSIAETRDLALNLLQAAEAATSDEMVFRIAKKLLSDEKSAVAFLREYRNARAEWEV